MEYKLIDPENKNLLELKEYGGEMILEMCDMMPETISKIFDAIENDLKNNDFNRLFLNIHALRANFRLFVPYEKSEFQFIIDVENEFHELMQKQRNNEEVSLSPSQLEEIESVRQLANELLKEVEIYARECREESGN